MKCPLDYYRAAFRQKVSYEGRKVTVPTLIVWGEPDVAFLTELAHSSQEYVHDLTVRMVTDTNHNVIVDKPAECNEIVREFLSEK